MGELLSRRAIVAWDSRNRVVSCRNRVVLGVPHLNRVTGSESLMCAHALERDSSHSEHVLDPAGKPSSLDMDIQSGNTSLMNPLH